MHQDQNSVEPEEVSETDQRSEGEPTPTQATTQQSNSLLDLEYESASMAEEDDDNDDEDWVDCPLCDGVGVVGGVGTSEICTACGGSGKMLAADAEGFDPYNFEESWSGIWHFKSEMDVGNVSAEKFDINDYAPREEAAPGVDWSGLDFSGTDLHDLDLSEADLTSCIFSGCNLTHAKLAGANLANASLSATLSGADLTGARLDHAYLDNADLREANLTGAHLQDTDFSGADLSGASLVEVNLAEAHLSGATLTHADLTCSSPQEALDLFEAQLWGVRGLTEEQYLACALKGAWARKASQEDSPGPEDGPQGADLRGFDLAGADLTDSDLTSADLRGVNLTGALLAGVKLSKAYLTQATLRDVDLKGVALDHANLSGVDLAGLSLDEADLTGALLVGTSLSNASMVGARLAVADVTNADLTGVNFSEAQLRATNVMAAASLRGANLVDATGISPIDRLACAAKGAISFPGAIPNITEQSETLPRRTRQAQSWTPSSKWESLGHSKRLSAAVDAFYTHYGRSEEAAVTARAAIEALAEAFDRTASPRHPSATIPTPYPEAEYFDDLVQIAEPLVIWLHNLGFEIHRREVDPGPTHNEI